MQYDNKRNKIDVTNKIKHYPKNTNGRTFVCGDIHGCYPELMHMLHLLGFDFENARRSLQRWRKSDEQRR